MPFRKLGFFTASSCKGGVLSSPFSNFYFLPGRDDLSPDEKIKCHASSLGVELQIMPLKVFLSHSTDPEENAIVWRLQTLAASSGIQVFVPQRSGSRLPSGRKNVPVLADDARLAIDQSDYILALITVSTGPAVEKELNYALGKGKVIIPIVEKSVRDHSFLKKFPRIFVFAAGGPSGQARNGR